MRVAVLGTGTMGAPMARNLAERAFGEVAVWNRSRDKAEPLAEDGCVVADTVAEAASGADAVLVMLSDGDAVLSVLDDALGAMHDDAILLQMSTVGIEATEKVAAAAGERGVAFVDAPVIGTKKPAQEGKLVVLASGPEEAVERCGAIFDAVAIKTLSLGEAGGGTRMKLVVNTWLVSLTASLGETLALAEALDFDPKQFLHTIAGGPLDVPYAHLKGNAMVDRELDEASFALSLATKDARLVLDAAARKELELPVVTAVAGEMQAAIDAGHGDKDMAAVFLAVAGPRE